MPRRNVEWLPNLWLRRRKPENGSRERRGREMWCFSRLRAASSWSAPWRPGKLGRRKQQAVKTDLTIRRRRLIALLATLSEAVPLLPAVSYFSLSHVPNSIRQPDRALYGSDRRSAGAWP